MTSLEGSVANLQVYVLLTHFKWILRILRTEVVLEQTLGSLPCGHMLPDNVCSFELVYDSRVMERDSVGIISGEDLIADIARFSLHWLSNTSLPMAEIAASHDGDFVLSRVCGQGIRVHFVL